MKGQSGFHEVRLRAVRTATNKGIARTPAGTLHLAQYRRTGKSCRATWPAGNNMPEIPDSNASKRGRERVIARARRDNLTVRQLAQIAGSYGGNALVGTPAMIADQMEEWLYSAACDGFNIMFPWVPGGLDDFVDRVVPELQRRNLFRREYEGKTLRENLGLPRPENRFFEKRGF